MCRRRSLGIERTYHVNNGTCIQLRVSQPKITLRLRFQDTSQSGKKTKGTKRGKERKGTKSEKEKKGTKRGKKRRGRGKRVG
jgi:hypothetical protein